MLQLWKRIRGTWSGPPPRRDLFCGAPRFERAGYLEAVAIIAAKLAKCDGAVRRSEIDCFKRLFPLTDGERAAVGPLFNLARESAEGFEPFAAEIARMLGEDPAERKALLVRFVGIAEADGELNGPECEFLQGLSRSLAVEEEWAALRARKADTDPYAVLGVPRDVSDEELRAAWHRLIRRFHPDAAAARGEEGVDHAPVAAINAAYRRIRRERAG